METYEVRSDCISGNSGESSSVKVRLCYTKPRKLAPYNYCLELQDGSTQLSVHMDREGARQLARFLLDTL